MDTGAEPAKLPGELSKRLGMVLRSRPAGKSHQPDDLYSGYIPALREAGKYQTDVGVPVRFLPLDRWYGLFEQIWIKRLCRATRWSLYAEERINTIAFMRSLREALAQDNIDLLYIQEYWSGRFRPHLKRR
jgi:hypothetical protein